MRILSKYFNEIEKIIAANYEISQSKNSSDKGEDREEFLVKIFNNHLPSIARATRGGTIIDWLDKTSSQTDIVISSAFTPQLSQNTKPFFLAEGCFAAIEVKSTLNASTFRQALKWSTRIKSLSKFIDDRTNGMLKYGYQYNSICTGIFAYKSAYKTPETIFKNLFEYSENGIKNSQMIDFICINNSYCIKRKRTEDAVGFIPSSSKKKTLEEYQNECRYEITGTPFVSMLDTVLKYICYIGPNSYSLTDYLHNVAIIKSNGEILAANPDEYKEWFCSSKKSGKNS